MFLSCNILSEIVQYLSLPELLIVSQVNKKFKESAKNQKWYKREFTKLWINNCNSSTIFIKNWKKLCVKGLRIETYWNTLPITMMSRDHLEIIYQEVKVALSNPEIFLPDLRKDMLSFPTILQDILANPEEIDASSNYYYIGNIENAINDIQNLISKDPEGVFINTLMPLLKAIQKSITLYCKGAKNLISESIDILEVYVEQWNSYSFAIKQLSIILTPISNMINDIYRLKESDNANMLGFSFVKIMTDIWKKKTFNKLKTRLFDNFLIEFDLSRKQTFCTSSSQKCKSFIESLLDISLNEISIHFKNYSKLTLDDPYKTLHDLVLLNSSVFYQTCDIDLEDYRVISFIFPQVTSVELKKLYNKIIGERLNTADFNLDFIDSGEKVEDYMIEFKAKYLGYTTSDIYKYSLCRNIKIIDVLAHIQYYRYEYCT